MRRECRERFPRHRLESLVSYPDMHHGAWPLSDKKLIGFLSDKSHACAVMHAGIANAGETFPAFPAHEQPAILRIWQEAHYIYYLNFTILKYYALHF